MAYNYFPNYYNSPYLQMPVAQTQATNPVTQTPVRNSDFVLVRSEDEARK